MLGIVPSTKSRRRTKKAITAAPCSKCPFRKDVPIYLRTERRQEIAEVLTQGQDFPCHATVERWEDDDGEEMIDTSDSQTCAGAAKSLMQQGGTTQLMRIAERLDMADLDKTAVTGAQVWDLGDWQRLAMGATGDEPVWDIGDEDGVRTCCVVDPGCDAPAGYMTPSGAAIEGIESCEGTCPACGESVCENCSNDEGVCNNCADDDYDEDDD